MGILFFTYGVMLAAAVDTLPPGGKLPPGGPLTVNRQVFEVIKRFIQRKVFQIQVLHQQFITTSQLSIYTLPSLAHAYIIFANDLTLIPLINSRMDGSSEIKTFHNFAEDNEHVPQLELQTGESASPKAVIQTRKNDKTIYVFDDWGRVIFLKK